MADDGNTEHVSSHHAAAAPQPQPTHEEMLAARLPPQERQQPDPVLQLSVGRLGAGSVTLVAIAAAIIIAVVLYGLNSPAPSAEHATAPAAASGGNNPSAAPAAKPAAPPASTSGHG